MNHSFVEIVLIVFVYHVLNCELFILRRIARNAVICSPVAACSIRRNGAASCVRNL